MRFKYFLRGLGVGIIFASIICLAAFREYKPSELSDREIMERAKELGMVNGDNTVDQLLKEQQTTLEDTSKEPSTKTEDEQKNNTEKKENEEGNTTEALTNEALETTNASTTEINEEQKENEEETSSATQTSKEPEEVEVTVNRGDSSYPVCQRLVELGVIEDATEFDNYLIENNYAWRIRVGTHKLHKGMTFQEIADAISDPLSE